MAINFHTQPKAKTENLDLVQSFNDLVNLKDPIEAQFGKLNHAGDVISNIASAITALNKYGDTDKAVISICNAERSLEMLCQKPFKDITKEVALEALDEAQKTGWQKFVDVVKEVIAKIIAFLRSLFTSTDQKIKYLKDLTEYTPTEKKYSVVPKDKAKILDLMITDMANYFTWMQDKVMRIRDTLNAGTIANEADVELEKILSKYSDFLIKKEGTDFPIITWAGDEKVVVTSTLAEAGYTDINKVKVFLDDINNKVLSVIRRSFVAAATKLEDGIASFAKWITSKSGDPNLAESGKLVKGLGASSMECLRVYSKISALLARTIDAIYTDAHSAKPAAVQQPVV